jgi:hypothetical protein
MENNYTQSQPRGFGRWLIITSCVVACLFSTSSYAQIPVTVTNNTNTTPNLAASYLSLAAALTDLNLVTAMSGPVTLTCTGGSSETTPVKGLVLGSATLNPVLSSTNTITINTTGGTATLNAGIGTSAGPTASSDGILILNGADYVTLDGLTFTDGNSASSTVAMEFGVGLFKRAAGDGCNNNTIQNCTFNMQRINNSSGTTPMLDGAWGIEVLNSTYTAATTSLTPTNGGTLATNGTNSANRFYTNTINGGNGGIGFGGYAASTGVGPTPTATTFLGDLGNDVGGTAVGTGNTILNFGGGAVTNPAAGIRANNQWSINIQYNNINNNNGSGVNHATTLRGIYGQAGTSANATISNNTITLKGGGTTTAVTGIENVIGATALSNTVTISGNIIQNCTYTTATTATMTGLLLAATATNVIANNNQVINNTIGAAATASSCTFQGMYCSVTAINYTANSNTVSGNTLANSFGSMYCMRASTSILNYDGNTIYNNTIPNNAGSSSSFIYGIYDGSSPTNETYTNNNIYNLTINGSNTSTSNALAGIYILTTSTGTKTVSGNNVNNLSFTSSSGTAYATIYGLNDGYGTTANIFNNTVHTLSSTGTLPVVYGISLATGSGTTFNVYNNLVGNLSTPASTQYSIYGIYTSSAATTINLYYNTVYLNGTSSGTGFGSAAVYVSSATPTTTLRNNIVVNLSTATGSNFTIGLRRISTALTSYGSLSNNNLFYCGTPSASNILYYDGTNADQTISAFKTRVATRESASFTETVSSSAGVFFQSLTGPTTGTSSTFLHLVNGLATQVESGGSAITGFTTDYDGNTRNATTPDIGADEFNGVAVDLSAPTISYTLIPSSLCPTAPSLSASITDASGVNTTAGTLPRLYYKKSVDANAYVGNTSADNGWKYVEASNASSPYNFTLNGSLLQSALTNGDVIQYFVVAQD